MGKLNMTRELSVQDWQEEINAALEYRYLHSKEKFWIELERCYYNDEDSVTSIGENLVFEQGDALLAGVSNAHPEIIIEAETPSSLRSAEAVEALDNQLLRKLKTKEKAVERAVLNCYLYSRGIIKIGYDSEFGFDPAFDLGSREDPWGMTLTQYNKRGHRIEYTDTNPGMPWHASILPHDFVVPWGVKDLDDAPWCAQRVVRLNQDLKDDPKYVNTRKLQPTLSMQSFMESYLRGRSKRERVEGVRRQGRHSSHQLFYNELWEIHDKRTGMVYVITLDYDKFLRRKRDALQINGELPYVSATFVPHSRHFWSTPLAFYLLQHQVEMFDLSKQISKRRRVSNLKFLIQENALSPDEEDKALSEDSGLFVKVSPRAGSDLSKIIQKFPQANTFDIVLEKNEVRAAARSAVGYSRNQVGQYDTSSRRTATEALQVKQGAEKRERRRFGVTEFLYIETMRKTNNMLFNFWKRQRSIKVGPQEWQAFAGADLKGDYYYDIVLSEKQPMGSMQRKIQALQLFGALAALPGANIPALWDYVSRSADDPSFQTFFNFGQGQGAPALPAGASVAGGVGGAQTGASRKAVASAPV